jgi:beta-ribofuranosylaminobenzene 5'-phosphate synthase
MRVRIKTPSRIHITLIDLNGEIGRIDGGIGLALNEPFIEIEASVAEEVSVDGGTAFSRAAKKLSDAFGRGISVKVLNRYESHVGLGSGTQAALAVAKAYQMIYSLDLTLKELAALVGRGGTSGVGVAAFERGGFILDGGHSKKVKKGFLPSSASRAPPPPILARYDFPDWDVVIATPDLKGYYGDEEINLFQKYCPISQGEVKTVSHLILMKILPSIIEEDLDAFREGIYRIQHTGFKRIEVEQYGELIKNIIELHKDSAAVGMSSTGPTVYAITDTNASKIERDFKSVFKDWGFDCKTTVTTANNSGALIEMKEVVEKI